MLLQIGDYSMISDSVLATIICNKMVSLKSVGSLTVFLHTAGKGASCPYCGHFSHRLHSYYSRHIEDLEVYGHTLELVIKVGKYYCDNVSCPQKKKYSANRCLFWLVGMVDGAILLRNASDR